MKFLSFVVLLIFNLDIVHSQTFDPFYLKDKNRSSIERVGDLFQIAIPIAGLGYTYYSDDVVVGELMEIAAIKGKKQNKNIKLGICGEHGGDPKSINFCSRIGLNYVSCSPYRVPVARLAAAQAQLQLNKKN